MLTKFDKSWTLFLDRDGVINEKRENDYIKNWNEFVFIPGALKALLILASLFENIIIVTNQRGVGKGLMTEKELLSIHGKMLQIVNQNAGRIDKIYYCIDTSEYSYNRKPNIGMGIQAKKDFPKINFTKSIMIGDSITDMEFGKNLGMTTIYIDKKENIVEFSRLIDFRFSSLIDVVNFLIIK